jgi:hypothetical protein
MMQQLNKEMVLFIMQCLQEMKINGKVTFLLQPSWIHQQEKSWEEPITEELGYMVMNTDLIIGLRNKILQEI